MRKLKELTSLPFVSESSANRRSFWTVPETGDFSDGTRIGTIMADAYVQYLSSETNLPPILPEIVLDMLNAEPNDVRRGQLVGFLSAIEIHLRRRTDIQQI